MEQQNLVLQMKNISKAFPGVKALDNIDFELKVGEVHALVGENGAGKSTLMKILSGFYKKDSGEIFLDGEKIESYDPRKAITLGISTIYQEIINIPNMTVAENILLSNRPLNKFGIIQWKEMESKVTKILKDLLIDLNATELVKNLSIAQQQLVEIVKALSLKSKIVIMDEPTSSLTETEKNTLFKIIRDLRSKKVSIIYISHKLEEVFEIADRVTVLRDGVKIATKEIKETNSEELIKFMIGREIEKTNKSTELIQKDELILEIKNFCNKNYFKKINFKLYQGEILGFIGLVGSGRSELMKSIFGLLDKDSGEILLNSKKVNISSPMQAIDLGIGFVSEDRKIEGLFLDLQTDQNITAANLVKISKLGVIISSLEK